MKARPGPAAESRGTQPSAWPRCRPRAHAAWRRGASGGRETPPQSSHHTTILTQENHPNLSLTPNSRTAPTVFSSAGTDHKGRVYKAPWKTERGMSPTFLQILQSHSPDLLPQTRGFKLKTNSGTLVYFCAAGPGQSRGAAGPGWSQRTPPPTACSPCGFCRGDGSEENSPKTGRCLGHQLATSALGPFLSPYNL